MYNIKRILVNRDVSLNDLVSHTDVIDHFSYMTPPLKPKDKKGSYC